MSASGLVTILFTDLVGSTDLASRIGDVAADELRRDHFADLREAIAQTGGQEVKTIGDAIMVSYTSAADALAGAVAMQMAVDRRNRTSARPSLEMRIGMSAGDASFEEGDWFGTPVIEASRLCADADGGQVLVSDLVRALAGSRSDVGITALGEREVKGLPDPIAVCEVGWSPEPATTMSSVPLPGFVETDPVFAFAGRTAERELLLTAWKEAVEGTRRIVLVSGEPGVGKTRLVTELVRTAHDQGALLLWGRCAEELDVPYQPFVEALRHYVHAVPADELRRQLGPLGGELSRLIPDLDHLVSGLSEPVHTEAETERHRLFEAVCDLLEAVTETTPTVLVLDDVHWADRPSLVLLRHVLRRLTSVPLLILATYRDTDLDRTHPLSDVLADLRREAGAERLDLQGLDPGEVTAFMEQAAGHALEGPGLELADAVHQETQGNAFFVGEMLLHLAESGLIVQRDGRWESDFSLEEVGIPEGIREVVGRRLSRLSDSANTVLTVAAVIGPEFDVAVIDAVSALGTDEIFDALEEAAGASIVREVTGVYGRYAFAHALVRSTLYDELSTNRRVRMHWEVGAAIEARHAPDLDPHLDALAHHFSEGALAGDPAKAVDVCRRAGERASVDLAFEAATAHFERGLGALELVGSPDPAAQLELQLGLVGALRAASNPRYREVGLAAGSAARDMDDPEWLARVAEAMTDSTSSRPGNLDDDVVRLLEDALEAIGPAPSATRAKLLTTLAVELFWDPSAKDRQQGLAREGMEMARHVGDPDALTSALLGVWALVDGRTPFMETVAGYFAEADAYASDDPVAQFMLGRYKTAIAASSGDGTDLLARVDANRLLAETIRQPRYIYTARIDQLAMSAFTGDLGACERQIEAALTYGFGHEIPEELVMSQIGAPLYLLRRAQGRVDELVEPLEKLVETQPGAPVWRVALAGAFSEGGRSDDAAEHLEFLTANQCANVPPDVEYPVTLCGIGRLTRTVALDEATMRYVYEHLAPFAGSFNWTGMTVSDASDHGLGILAARLGDFDASDAHFAGAVALSERVGARPYLAGEHLDWAELLVEREEFEGAATHARAALEIGEAIGMDGPFGVVVRATAILDELDR